MTQTEALLAIAKRNGGTITPAAVIAEARDKNSVLHGAFTWDNTVAANKWRTLEAQRLIRRCVVTIEDSNGGKIETYAFVGLSVDRDGESPNNPYRLARDVAKAEDLLAVAEGDALEQLKGIKGRYEHLKRLGKVWDAIDEAAERVGICVSG